MSKKIMSNVVGVGPRTTRNNSAITLVALVITIIVLLILSAVTLNMILGENGIITKAKQAADSYKNAESDELAKLNNLNDMIVNNGREETNYDSQTISNLISRINTLEAQVQTLQQNSIRYVDYTNVLDSTTLKSRNASYTATQDCAVVGEVQCDTNDRRCCSLC